MAAVTQLQTLLERTTKRARHAPLKVRRNALVRSWKIRSHLGKVTSSLSPATKKALKASQMQLELCEFAELDQ